MSEKTGTFLVTEADEEGAVLQDVADSQVHPLAENPGIQAGTVLEGTIASEPPLDVVWTIESVAETREIDVSIVDERPTKATQDVAADIDTGDITVYDRVDDGEIHVLRVPEERTEAAMADVEADRSTVVRAARLGVRRVEIRGEAGVVSIRYLP